MVNWYGFALNLDTSNIGWDTALTKGDKWSFNAIRIAIRFSTMNLTHLDEVITKIASHGAKAVLDYHILSSWMGYGPQFGSAECTNIWLTLAQRYRNNPNVLAFELGNEPTTATLDPSITNNPTSIQVGIINYYAYLTDQIRAIDPNRTVIWIDYWNEVDPTPYFRPNVIVTHHPYCYSTLSGTSAIQPYIDNRMTEVEHRTRGLFDIWMGETETRTL